MKPQTGLTKTGASAPATGGTTSAVATFRDMLTKAGPSIAAVLPKHLSAERLMKVALTNISRQPELLDCTPLSIVQGVIVSAQLGLEIGGPLQQAHLVAYANKKQGGRKEAQFIPGYRGLIELARRGGEVVSIEARNVYAGDTFEVEYTLEGTKLRHVPAIDGERGRLRAVYAFARVKGSSEPIFDLLTAEDVAKARASSQAARAGFGPWVDNEEEMWRKTAVKRLSKYLPLTPELAAVSELENRAENEVPDISGLGFDAAEVISETMEPPKATKGAAGLKAAVAGNGAPAAQTASEPPASQQAAPAQTEAEPAMNTPTEEDIDRPAVVAKIREKLASLSEGKTNGPSYRNSLVSAWSEGWVETNEALDDADPKLLALVLSNALNS